MICLLIGTFIISYLSCYKEQFNKHRNSGITLIYQFFQISIFNSEISRSYYIFKLLRKSHTVIHHDRENSHSNLDDVGVPFCPCFGQHQHFLVFFITTTLLGVRWHLAVNLILISLISNVEHLNALVSCMPSFPKCLFRSPT